MYGIVLLDSKGKAYKVGRFLLPGYLASLADEYEWIKEAHKVDPSHVVKPLSWHPDQGVLVKRYVEGRPFGWAPTAVHDHFRALSLRMQELDWGMPEYKDSSYIRTETGFVLVDASMANRLCGRLARFIQEWLRGKRPAWAVGSSTPSDLSFYLRREVQEGCLDPRKASSLIAELESL